MKFSIFDFRFSTSSRVFARDLPCPESAGSISRAKDRSAFFRIPTNRKSKIESRK